MTPGDLHARSLGYKSEQEMLDFLRQRQVGQTRDTTGELEVPMYKRLLMLHPKFLLEYVANKWDEATKR